MYGEMGGADNVDMFERYTEKARRALFFAGYEASNYGSSNIESAHLLLGLLRETTLLQGLLIGRESIEVLRKEIEAQTIRRPAITAHVEVPFSNECTRVLGLAAQESEGLGHGYVGPEHLLLGLLREDQCLGARLLQAHEVTLSRVREKLARSGLGAETKSG